MKKKVAAIFMASIMACSMAACGSSGGSSDSGKTDSKDKSTASSTAENGSGEVEKIIVSFPTWTGAPADTEKVQEAINDITRDKIGVEIELSITDFGSFNQNTTLALSANEEIDVLACVGFPYATEFSRDIFPIWKRTIFLQRMDRTSQKQLDRITLMPAV